MTTQTTAQDIYDFANHNPACHLATLDGDQPRVRGMLLWFADKSGFYFHTSSTKKLTSQLFDDAKVEVAFLKSTADPSQMQAMRAYGKVKIIHDETLDARLLTERPWLKSYEGIEPQAKLVLFKIANGEAFIWDMSKNLQEASIERIAI